ncbi:hypothetical protein BDV98DRAFT_576543 [Pterulicium gracile]|uniref:Uncharacterized protein n=1 Tax=Pterulicium gracile TaxID=1884261 RepID=A0A5C3Q3T8_9AGAR|nr:hypothetical protein BDV98DRAFT_576543 [Pterula gracilis]
MTPAPLPLTTGEHGSAHSRSSRHSGGGGGHGTRWQLPVTTALIPINHPNPADVQIYPPPSYVPRRHSTNHPFPVTPPPTIASGASSSYHQVVSTSRGPLPRIALHHIPASSSSDDYSESESGDGGVVLVGSRRGNYLPRSSQWSTMATAGSRTPVASPAPRPQVAELAPSKSGSPRSRHVHRSTDTEPSKPIR